MGSEGFVIEQKGPNGWQVVGLGGLFAVALIIIALALFNLATEAGIALMILAGGRAAYEICHGVALIVVARGRAVAMIGSAARADMKALGWGESDGEG